MQAVSTLGSINTQYTVEITNKDAVEEFTVRTPFGEVAVLKSKDQLRTFIHEQTEKIHQWTPVEGGSSSSGTHRPLPTAKVVHDMSHSLKEIGAKIEKSMVKSEALGHLKAISSAGKEGPMSGAAQTEKIVADMKDAVGRYGSEHTKKLLEQHVKYPIPEHQLYLMVETLQVLHDMESVGTLKDMHALYSFPPGIEGMEVDESLMKDEAEFRAGLNTFIQFAIGSRAIDILVPKESFPMQHHVLKEFYNDESHPMDLQRFLRTEDRAQDVTTVIKNLSVAMNKEEFKAHRVFTGGWESDYNPFIQGMVEARPRAAPGSPAGKSLLDIETVQPQIGRLRDVQKEYYKDGIKLSDETVQAHYTFSTTEERKGIFLCKEGEEPEAMKFDAKTKFIKDKGSGLVYLRVPDAGDRVVQMSIEGYKGLKAVQKKSVDDLKDVRGRLEDLFKDQPSKKVTGRTKSVLGILDKTGRLCKLTQSNPGMTAKYTSIRDIIDINGMRITCTDSSELAEVIDVLKANKFEFLELDNKYNTIRKQGSYKVIPTTVRDPVTGCVFELQLTTVSALSISDLDHNVNYKKDAIGLDLDDKEREWVSMLSKFSAIVETLNVMGYPVPLTSEMSRESLEKLSSTVVGYLKPQVENPQEQVM